MPPERKEVEVKVRVTDAAALRRRLAKLRARPAARAHEMNTLYDTPQGGFARHGQLLRIRVEQPSGKGRRDARVQALLTYKGPAQPANAQQAAEGRRYKVRDEFEVEVADPEQMRRILEALGLRPWFQYEKYRTPYRLPRLVGLEVDFDETPIGEFLEFEGAPEAIDRGAALLGYGPADYITKSYGMLYLEHCRREGLDVGAGPFGPNSRLPGMLFQSRAPA